MVNEHAARWREGITLWWICSGQLNPETARNKALNLPSRTHSTRTKNKHFQSTVEIVSSAAGNRVSGSIVFAGKGGGP
jgi:hypothetical protein